MKKLALILSLVFSSIGFGQTEIEDLKKELKTLDNDSLIARKYRAIGIRYGRVDLDSALAYFIKSEELTKKRGLEQDWAMSLYRKATVYRGMNLYDKAIKDLQTAWDKFYELNYHQGLADVKIEQAQVAAYQNRPIEAVDFYLEAIPLAKEIGNLNSEARVYNNLANVFADLKQYTKAIEYYQSALEIVIALEFKPGISACLTNLGSTYSILGENDKALLYLRDALLIKEETGDKLGASRVLSTLGQIYQEKKDYMLAEVNYQKAYQYAKEVGNIQDLSRAEFGLAQNAYDLKNFERCISLAANVIANLQIAQDLELLADAHQLISKAYKKENELAKALDHSISYNKLSDSLYNKNILSITNDLEARYQNEQKVKEIALLSTEKDLQQLQLRNRANERNIFIALAFIVLIIAGLLYNQYRIKQSSNKKLHELDQLKSNFFANISHEFRTPLTLIKGPMERLIQDPDKKLDSENISMIYRNTNRLLKLVNQLLDLSKIDAGSLNLEPQQGDVYKCLRAVSSSFDSYAAQNGNDYRVEIPVSPLWTSFDREKLEKIGYNLLSNAFKFGEPNSAVTMRVWHNGQQLMIEVSDTGKGIADDKIPFVFDRFYQVESGVDRDSEGTGIGLSLTKELVELMGGTIKVSSKLHQGSTFTTVLPLSEIKDSAMISPGVVHPNIDPPLSVLSAASTVADRRKLPVILLVEDNPDMRAYLRETLIDSFKIREANNGESGIKSALNYPPDLIITDLMMPVMDGLEFCKKVKTNILTSHIPVVMLTAKAGLKSKLEGLETGADDYLTKPFDSHELLIRSRNLIEQRQMLRARYIASVSQMEPAEITVSSIDQKFLKRMLGLLEEHYREPDYGVPQLQSALAMSRAQFQRKVKALTNETPGTLLRHFRLKRAAQLLDQNADTVTQIAYSVGFNNLSYFTKCFRELYGITPSDYSLKLHTS